MSGIGHNSAAYGEDISGSTEVATDKSVSFRFIDLHLGDWLGGTNGLNCEIEGAYIRFLVRLYQRGKPFPDEDREMASSMNVSLRVWRRLREELLSRGKILARNGCLTNKRFEEERIKRAEQIRKQSDAVRSRWEKQRANPETSSKFAGSLDETSPKISENFGIEINKINELDDSSLIPPFSHSHTQIEDSVPSDEGTGDESPLPTSREIIWDKGIAWLRTRAPEANEVRLRQRVGRWVKDYGDEQTLIALRKAFIAKPVSPLEWIEKVLAADDAANGHVRRVGSKLEVYNGFRAELASILDGRDVDRSLARIAGRIPAHVTGVDLEARVRALAVEIVESAADGDRRYAAAAESGRERRLQGQADSRQQNLYDGVL